MPPVAAPATASVAHTCTRILELLLPHRRAADPERTATAADFPVQLQQLAGQVALGEPILFTLPGFPCKSPNPRKVLGHLPDEGERLALTFLNQLCVAVEEVYPPGARILICSDGHIFGDLIRVPDEHIDAYSDELSAMIRQHELRHLAVFDLREVLGDLPNDEKRSRVHNQYAPDLAALREEVRTVEDTKQLYCGITRFLLDDTADFTGTRSALQRECRQRAYGVIQRSRAWGDLIVHRHPGSVRLSIHPQPVGAAKYGIRLLNHRDTWATPWHTSVLHRADGQWELLHRTVAEQLGRLVSRDGRPSHFEAC